MNKIFKLFVTFCLIFGIFIVPAKATSEKTYYSREEQLIEILDDYFLNDSCYEFYDVNGNLTNGIVDDMKDEYLKEKISTVLELVQHIDSSIKTEDITRNTREVVPGGGGSGSGSVYKTKKITYTKDIAGYGYVKFTFTGRVRVGKYLEWIDTNIADANEDFDLYDKYKVSGNNFSVKFDSFLPCYGSNTCSIYHYIVQYRVSLYIQGRYNPFVRDNQLENVHVPIWARDYQWFNSGDEFYSGL